MEISNKTIITLGVILFFAFVVRFYNLSSVPPGLFCDEAERGVSAYSILKTGKDWHGQSFPIFFQSFGDYVPPVQTYSAIPFVQIFGLNELSVRLPSVFWGVLAVFFLFTLGSILGSPRLGLWSALFLTLEPWSVHYSRFGVEFMAYLAFFLLSLTLSFASLKKKRVWPWAFLSWALTFYTYQPAKLIVPLFLFSFLILNLQKIQNRKREIFIGLVVFFLVSLPLFLNMISGLGFKRFEQVSIFSSDLTDYEKLSLFLNLYLNHFSPSFLFSQGDPTFITRHLTAGLTPLLLVQFFLIPLGIIFLIKKKSQSLFLFLLSWALIYPVSGALTSSGPLSSRSVIGAPFFALLSGFGAVFVIDWLSSRKKWLKQIAGKLILFFILLNFFFFYSYYLKIYPQKSADFWGWQYGPKEIVQYFKEVENNYDQLIMTGQFNAPEIFFKFYAPDSCQKCIIGNTASYNPAKKQIFALTLNEIKDLSFETQKTIFYPDGTTAFVIGEIK